MPFQSLYTNIFNGRKQHANEFAWLLDVTEKYPYFSLAHFFLLKQTPETYEAYQRIAGKTAIHFNNPFLLHEQLHQPAPVENIFEPVIAPGEKVFEETQLNIDLVEETPVEPVMAVQEAVETFEINGVPNSVEINDELPSNNSPVTEVIPLPVTQTAPEQEVAEQEPVKVPVDDVETKLDAEALMDEATETTANIVEEFHQPLPSIKPPVTETPGVLAGDIMEKDVPIFQPLFASDYFASQGIKLSEEQLPSDRMGKQLKSFTEWLKTMKKVHDNKLPPADAPVDLTVQTLAEKSNKEEEVLTEAMAEVFLQQGKTNKAKEIYEKLSLLNPSKSAYFAAKLEQIK
jgi:hypothetical protein